MKSPSYGVTTAAVWPANSGCASFSSVIRALTESMSSWAAAGLPMAVPMVRVPSSHGTP